MSKRKVDDLADWITSMVLDQIENSSTFLDVFYDNIFDYEQKRYKSRGKKLDPEGPEWIMSKTPSIVQKRLIKNIKTAVRETFYV